MSVNLTDIVTGPSHHDFALKTKKVGKYMIIENNFSLGENGARENKF